MMIVEVFQDKAEQWRVRLRGSNNRVILSGESYFQKSNAVRAAKTVRNAAYGGVVAHIKTKAGDVEIE